MLFLYIVYELLVGPAAVTSRSLTRRSGARSDCPSHDSHQLVPLPPPTLASMRATTVRPRRPWIMLSAAGRFTASPCSLGATPHNSERLRIRTCVGVWVFARVLCVLVLRFPCACFCLSSSVVCAFCVCAFACFCACLFLCVVFVFWRLCVLRFYVLRLCVRVFVRFVCVHFAFCVFRVRVSALSPI